MKSKPKKQPTPSALTAKEAEAVLAAIYTQIESIKNNSDSDFDWDLRAELKLLRSAERKIRKVLRLVTS